MPTRKLMQPSPPIALDGLPGHQIRRVQQIAVGLFMDETSGFNTSTIAGVIDRLERRALMQRNNEACRAPANIG